MTRALHVALALGGSFVLWRAAIRVAQLAPDDAVAAAFPLAVLIATSFGSVAAIVAGRTAWAPRRALALDAATIGGAAWWLFVLTLGPWTRELGGVSLVCVAVARLAPGALAVITPRAPSWLAFVVALGGYGALAVWLPAASLPFGDQVHYLLGADQLRRGTLDAAVDPQLFQQLVGFSPGSDDVGTHVADTPLGPRPIQGYALQLVLLPGWAIGGRLGAHLTMAVVGAWASYQTFLILRDLHRGAGPGGRGPAGGPVLPSVVAGWTWVLSTFLAPMALLATHLYPNMLGAAIVATAFRAGFTGPVTRPALAAAVLALTLFLTPRDGIALLVLLPFLLMVRADRVRVVVGAGAVALIAVIVNALAYGLPLPYAGYAFGTAQAQAITQEPSISPRFWIGLPAILFDRTFGLAGTAPWVFIGLLGLAPLIRFERARRREDPQARPILVPAALTVGLTLLALSFFRLWEGGYAPPNRYLVGVLPLWTPFVAVGLMFASGRLRVERAGALVEVLPGARVVRPLVAVTLLTSALMALVLGGVPTTALNGAFDHQVRDALARILGLDPLAWLPSFQPTTADWYIGAYLRLIPAVAIAAGLVILGAAVATRLQGPGPLAAARQVASAELTLATPEKSAQLLRFLVMNAVALALVAAALVMRPFLELAPVPTSLMGRWLPLALAVATAGSLVVAREIPLSTDRESFLRRHFLVYVPAVALLVLIYAGGAAVQNAQLGALYVGVGVIFALNALAALWQRIDYLSDRAIAVQLACVALVAFLVVLPYDRAVMLTASDEPHYLLIAQSIVRDRDLDLVNDYAGDYAAFYPGRLPDVHAIHVGSALFPIRDLGLPVLAALPYALAGRVGVLILMCLVGAALALQLYLMLRDLRFDPPVAFLAVATTVLVHPILTYTTQVYPELLVALVFVTAARVLRAGESSTVRQLAVASALVGVLPVLATRAWPIAAGVGLVVAYSALRPARGARSTAALVAMRVAAGALPFVAIVLALSLLNWRMFEVFLPSAGYYLIRDQQVVLAFGPHIGGTGLLLDRVFGLLPRAPIYLLGFLGLWPLWRRVRTGHGPEIAALALGGGLSFLYIANIAYWWSDGSPPSRYLLGAIPLFVAAVAGGWEVVLRATGRARAPLRWLAWGTVIASAAVVYLYAIQPNTRYDAALDIRARGSSGRLFGYLDERIGLDPAQLFPSLVAPDLTALALALPWIALALVLVWIGRRSTAAPPV